MLIQTDNTARKLEETWAHHICAVVAIYDTHGDAEDAIRHFQRLGFDLKELSIVGKDFQTEENVVGYYNAGERMKAWGKAGAFWGGLWGLLFGSAFFFVPGVGPLLVAGPLVGWIIAALEGAVVVDSLGVLGAGLYSLGIPKDSIFEYETAIRAGKFVVVAHGTESEIDRAKKSLHHHGATRVHVHSDEKLYDYGADGLGNVEDMDFREPFQSFTQRDLNAVSKGVPDPGEKYYNSWMSDGSSRIL